MVQLGLNGKRVLISQSREFMGPALCELFAVQGAEVIADERPLPHPALPAQIVAQAGRVDILIAHLAVPAPSTPAHEVDEEGCSRTWSLRCRAWCAPCCRR